ncbi:MAG: hypothetical protein ACREMC_02475 [Gemmatimonadales bacterium]
MRHARCAAIAVVVPLILACGRRADLVITGGMVWTGLSTGRA